MNKSLFKDSLITVKSFDANNTIIGNFVLNAKNLSGVFVVIRYVEEWSETRKIVNFVST